MLASITLLSTASIIARESQLLHRYTTFTSPRSRREKSSIEAFRALMLVLFACLSEGTFDEDGQARLGCLKSWFSKLKKLTRDRVQVSSTSKSNPVGSSLLTVRGILAEINIL